MGDDAAGRSAMDTMTAMATLTAMDVMAEARRLQGVHGARLLWRMMRRAGNAVAHPAEAFAARHHGQLTLR